VHLLPVTPNMSRLCRKIVIERERLSMATTHTPLLRATVSADAPLVSLNMIATPITRHSFPIWISRLDQDASGNGPIPAMCLVGKRECPRCRHLVLRLTRRVRQELASRPFLRRKCAPPAPARRGAGTQRRPRQATRKRCRAMRKSCGTVRRQRTGY
jgi:hypothetical protein